jgi:outer membrane protein TolC
MIPTAPETVVVGIPADLLRRRPDVRAAERQAAAESARIGIAAAEFYPHIGITGLIGLESENLSNLFEGENVTGAVGPTFRWNILNYGRIQNNVRAQDAKFREAVITYQQTVLHANEEADSGIAAFLQEKRRAESLEAAAAATQLAVNLAVLQYEKGLVDYQPVLDTQRDLVVQQDNVAQSRGQVAVNLVAVYKALAGGWQMRLCEPLAGEAASGKGPVNNLPANNPPAGVGPRPGEENREILPPGDVLPPPRT